MVKYRKLIGIFAACLALSVMASSVTVSAEESELQVTDELVPIDTEVMEDTEITEVSEDTEITEDTEAAVETENTETAEGSEITEDTETFGLQSEGMPDDTLLPSMVPFSYETNKNLEIAAIGSYVNWDGVTNVAQFKGPDGTFCFAADNDKSVIIYRTDANHHITQTLTVKKKHPIFGTVICDSNWNYYIVTGENNDTDDTSVETVFISKYDSKGNHIATTGDNGRSSLAYSNDSFYTKRPFEAGNCDAAIYGNILTVNYARLMYAGHQSNSVFSVNTANMSKVSMGDVYESHSFAQRVVPTNAGFVYVSEGDCFDRAFVTYSVKISGNTVSSNEKHNIFDFWVKDGTYDKYDMFVLNNNFAHMGGLATLSDGKIAFAASSAKSLNSNAEKESEEIFIQIFDPYKDLNSAASYVTTGVRSGLGGPNGRDNKTNYGVKWLTSYGTNYSIENVQLASTSGKQIVVLYELYKNYKYAGVYYIVLNESGNVIKNSTLLSEKARLNPCEMPVSAGGKIYWTGNKYNDQKDQIYIYSLDTSLEKVSVKKNVTARSGLKYTGNAQTLVNAGEVTGGKFMYALGSDDHTLPSAAKYKEAVPSATKSGTYYVWFKAVGDDAHYDSDEACLKVKLGDGISKSLKDADVLMSAASFGYTGQKQKPKIRAVIYKGKTLKKGTDYTVKWSDADSKKVGKYSVKITGKGDYDDFITVTYKIVKAKNPLKVSLKKGTQNVKYSKLKKKDQTIKLATYLKVSKNKGAVTYSKVKGKTGIKVDKKTGKITVKKGLKKGKYTVKIKATAAGNGSYKAGSKTVTLTINVK